MHRHLALTLAATTLAATASLGLTTAPSDGAAAFRCAGRVATIVGNDRSNHLDGTSGPDVIVGRGGHDDIEGHGGNDVICGNRGDDELEGGRGDDHLYGGLGRDEAEGGPGHDTCVAEEQEGC